MNKKDLLTPCFLLDFDSLICDICDLKHEMAKQWKSNIIGYSFKTNNLPGVIEIMKEQGLFAEVVSDDEFDLAIELGFPKDKIIFNGPVKSETKFLDALSNGSIINIDSKRELKWLANNLHSVAKTTSIGLRVNFCIEELCPGESQCGNVDGRFGFSYETGELEDAIDFMLQNNIVLNGLHLHSSSKTRSLNIYKALANKACEIIKKYDLNLDFLDFGGGFFGKMPNKPSFEDYFKTIGLAIDNHHLSKQPTIIIEPGMALIGRNMSYVCEIIDFKKTKNNYFAITDGSRIHIDPLQKKTSYFYEIEKKHPSNKKRQMVTLCGFTCMENDRFLNIDSCVNVGDKIVFSRVGAYTIGLSPLFIQFYPTIYLKSGDSYSVLRKKMTASEFRKIGEII